MIQNQWLSVLKDEFKKDYYAKLFEFVKAEYATRQILVNWFSYINFNLIFWLIF